MSSATTLVCYLTGISMKINEFSRFSIFFFKSCFLFCALLSSECLFILSNCAMVGNTEVEFPKIWLSISSIYKQIFIKFNLFHKSEPFWISICQNQLHFKRFHQFNYEFSQSKVGLGISFRYLLWIGNLKTLTQKRCSFYIDFSFGINAHLLTS